MKSPEIATGGRGQTLQRRKRAAVPKIVEQRNSSGTVRWMISGLYVDGKRKREFFTDPDTAKRRLQMLQTARANTGALAERIAKRPELAADAGRAADLLAPLGLSLLDAARVHVECLKALEGTGLALLDVARDAAAAHASRRAALTLEALGARFLSDPETLKLSRAYLVDVRNRWRRFQDDMGAETLACDVTPDRVRRWLAGLDVAAISKGNFHRTCSAVFSYAMHAELVRENPFRKVKKPVVETKDGVEVFTPEQMGALLRAADQSWLPALAIGGFAGLRPEELRRLEWDEVDLKAGFIEVKASKSKTGRRRLVTISANLLSWLEPCAREKGRVVNPNERKKRLAAMKAAGIERWPSDVLRHSFASYHLAAHKDMNGTALELGHNSTTMLFRHYREAVKPEAARAWWALMPEKCGNVLAFPAGKTGRKKKGAAA
ncbi:MAG TPA: tyrosine-type recombinase/integrase [Prosthecobacter sp.]|nr:tyrosine-type recombinase/integrase [Prosthecobacter sp.]HRK16993.1 tyrosine-type recombinase/integrase [Prosthecobacter sp.]